MAASRDPGDRPEKSGDFFFLAKNIYGERFQARILSGVRSNVISARADTRVFFSCLNKIRNLRVAHVYILNLHRGQIVQFATFRCVNTAFAWRDHRKPNKGSGGNWSEQRQKKSRTRKSVSNSATRIYRIKR